MDKFQQFLERKAEKARPLKKSFLAAKIESDNLKSRICKEMPDLPLGHDYSQRYLQGFKGKFRGLDKKVLPEYLDDAMRADVALQRSRAFEKAEKFSSKFVNRKRNELSGTNFRIPEWAIVREESLNIEKTPEVSVVSFPKQFYSEVPPNLDIVDVVESCKGFKHSEFSEPKLQGFHNEEAATAYFPVDPENSHKGFFRNYLEVARLSSSQPFYSWVEAQNREMHPIHTLVSRAKKLDPIFKTGKAQRPFPVEVGGVTYLCDGDAAERMFELLRKEDKLELFVQCCIVKAKLDFLDPENIVHENKLIGPFWKLSRPEEEPEPGKPDSVTWSYGRELLDRMSESELQKLVEAGIISSKQAKAVEDYRVIRGMLPAMTTFLYLLGDDKRQEALADHSAKESMARAEIESVLGKNWGPNSWMVSQESIFDNSDEEGGFGLFGDDDEETGLFPTPEPSEEENSDEEVIPPEPENKPVETEEVPTSDALNFAKAKSEELNREKILWDPRFVSEIRLWPVSYKYWEPP